MRWPVLLYGGMLTTLVVGGCPPPWADGEWPFNQGQDPPPVDVVDPPVFQSEMIFNEIAGKVGSHSPTLTIFPDNELLAAWYSYDGPEELNGAVIYTSRLPAGAEAWSTPEVLVDQQYAVGNPVLYSEQGNVWFFHAVIPGTGWSTAHVDYQRSFDRGRTWTTMQTLSGPLGTNVRYPPVRLGDGRLLLPAYNDLFQESLFYVSADDETWSWQGGLAARLLNANLQPSVAVLDDGRLLAVMRNPAQGWLWVSYSEDAGRSWVQPTDSGFPNPASPAALVKLAGGNLLLVYNDSDAERRPLSVALSSDEGGTWNPPRVLVEGEGEYAYPTVVQAPDGLIHIVYSHNRETIGHLVLNEAWIIAGA